MTTKEILQDLGLCADVADIIIDFKVEAEIGDEFNYRHSQLMKHIISRSAVPDFHKHWRWRRSGAQAKVNLMRQALHAGLSGWQVHRYYWDLYYSHFEDEHKYLSRYSLRYKAR